METCKCVKCGRMFVGYSIEELDRCDKCNGELYWGKLCVDNKEVSNMNFTDAIGKYDAITRDGGKTVYSKNSEGNIIMKTNGIGGGFQLNYDLLVSTGWEEHKEPKLIVPERVDYSKQYLYIESDGNKVYTDSDCRFDEDADRLKTFNYFTDKDLAQYIADKQLIDRVYLVLDVLNENRFNTLDKLELIDTYIDKNYKEVLDRINEYEIYNRVQY